MSHAAAVQNHNPATVPAKTVDGLVLEGSTELIVLREIAGINAALERFNFDYRIPADDTRLNEVASKLAAANHAELKLDEELATLKRSVAVLDVRFAQCFGRMNVIRGERRACDLDPREESEFFARRDEVDAICRASIRAQEELERVDKGAATAAISRSRAELDRAEFGILKEMLAEHAARAERALLDFSTVELTNALTREECWHARPDCPQAHVCRSGDSR